MNSNNNKIEKQNKLTTRRNNKRKSSSKITSLLVELQYLGIQANSPIKVSTPCAPHNTTEDLIENHHHRIKILEFNWKCHDEEQEEESTEKYVQEWDSFIGDFDTCGSMFNVMTSNNTTTVVLIDQQ
jgi:hypothetical protein